MIDGISLFDQPVKSHTRTNKILEKLILVNEITTQQLFY